MDLFEQNILDNLNQKCTVGYAYIISKDGNLVRQGTDGKATMAVGGQQENMSIDSRISIASISKYITALGMIRVVYDNPDVDFNNKIGPFLPASFNNATQDFKNITIHQLLTHTSGIKQNGQDGLPHQSFSFLKGFAESFIVPDNAYEYSNKNFSLCRLILPNILPGIPWTGGLSEEEAYAVIYKAYITENILNKAGISNPSLQWESGYARLYNCFSGNEVSTGTADWELISGAAGWYLSARELASLLAYTFYSENILLKEERNFVYQSGRYYGFDDFIEGEDYGNYLIKGGSFSNYIHNFIVHYPNGIQFVLITTGSDYNATQYLQFARDAFDDAWQ